MQKSQPIEEFINLNQNQIEPALNHLTFTYEGINCPQSVDLEVSHFQEISSEKQGLNSDNQFNESSVSASDSDSEMLKKLHADLLSDKNKWKKIHSIFKGKYSIEELKFKFKEIKNRKQRWTFLEKSKILNLLKQNVDLSDIYGYFSEKTKKSVQKMHLKFKRAFFEKEPKFSAKEDEKLLEMVEQLGKKWKIISNYFIGKSLNQLKNRYYSVLLKSDKSKIQINNQIQSKNKTCGIARLYYNGLSFNQITIISSLSSKNNDQQ